jgi:hypothetical protein
MSLRPSMVDSVDVLLSEVDISYSEVIFETFLLG